MVGDFGWEHEGTKSGVGTVKYSSKSMYVDNIILKQTTETE